MTALYVPWENAIEIDWTVSLYAISDKRQRNWITELDVRLDLAYWDNGEDASQRFGYELRGVWTPAGYITLKTDAAWFKLICEGLEHDHAAIMDKLFEIEPGISCPRFEAAE